MNKNEDTLKSFVKYCLANKEQRFWQALRNWSRNAFVCTSEDMKEFKDTFHYEGRIK